jgi:hypothetical protein
VIVTAGLGSGTSPFRLGAPSDWWLLTLLAACSGVRPPSAYAAAKDGLRPLTARYVELYVNGRPTPGSRSWHLNARFWVLSDVTVVGSVVRRSASARAGLHAA